MFHLPSLAALALGITACTGSVTSTGVSRVSRTVALNGQSLSNARIVFSVINWGRQSESTTDAAGNYLLVGSITQYGAVASPHQIRVTTALTVETPPEALKKLKEFVPDEYNT